MGSTLGSDLVLGVRKLIPEATANDWTDLDLLAFIQQEYVEWCATLGMRPDPGWFTMDITFTLAAGQTTVALPTLFTGLSIGFFAAVKSLWYVPSTAGREIRIEKAFAGQESMWRLAVGTQPTAQGPPDRYWLTRPVGVVTLNVHPASAADALYRLYVRYQPPDLTLGTSAQTDPRHNPVLVRGAALRALETVNEDDKTIRLLYEADKLRFQDEEALSAGEATSETTKVEVSDEMFGSN